jgi:Tfp pilus assembly protein PilV
MSNIKTQVVQFCKDLDKVASNRNSLIAQIATALAKIRSTQAKWAWVRENVAEPIASHYKGRAVIRETRNGSLTFDVKGSEKQKHDAAYSRLRALVSESELLSGSGNTNQRKKTEEVAPRKTKRVSQLLVMFNDLSEAERKAFLAEAK